MKNLKKSIVLAVLMGATSAALAAGISRISRLGPSAPTLAADGTGGQWVTIAAAGAGVRNCLSALDASSNAQSFFTMRVLDGGTTAYAVDATSYSFVRSFREDEMCGSANTAMYIKMSSVTATVLTSTQRISYSGYTY